MYLISLKSQKVMNAINFGEIDLMSNKTLTFFSMGSEFVILVLILTQK